MKKRILVASLMVMIATPVFGDSAIFTTRRDADVFWSQCLTPGERPQAQVAGRKNPAQVGFTVFYVPGDFVCDGDTPQACVAQRCEPQASVAE